MFSLPKNDLRFFFFLCAIFIYALLGSPTPDNPSYVEALIGLCLVLGAGFSSVPLLLHRPDPSCRWLRWLFFYGMSVVIITGLIKGGALPLMIRDVLPFFFVCLPLFFRRLVEDTPGREHLFLFFCWGLGCAFAVRVLGPFYGFLPEQEELFYLANSPVLLFTAICAVGYAFENLQQIFSAKAALKFVICIGGAVLCVAAMGLDVQRATIGAVFLSLLFLILQTLVKAPRRLVLPVIVIGGVTFVYAPVLADLLEAMNTKTLAVGLNNRLEDFEAVLKSAELSLFSVLFGQGWGATYHSPAVEMMAVPYTHSFLTYMFLKGGVVMALLAVMVLVSALRRIWLIYRRGECVFALALFWALVIPYFLYASHKSLDFGLILLLIYSLGTDRTKPAQND